MIFIHRASLNDDNASVLEPLSIPTDDDNVGDNEILLTGPYTVSSVSGTESTDVDHTENEMICNDSASWLFEFLNTPTDEEILPRDNDEFCNSVPLSGFNMVFSSSGAKSTDSDHTNNEMNFNVGVSFCDDANLPTDDDVVIAKGEWQN
jgi:hypothetical protein